MRFGWRVAAAALLSLGLGLAVAEIGASRVLPTSGTLPPDLFVADAKRGLALRPGFHGIITRAGHAFPVSINDAGYRDDAFSGDGTVPRLLVIGSSAGFGVGLPRDAGLIGRLARDLAPRYAVLNAAIYTYGPVQELETLRRECPKLRPALVLDVHEYKDTRTDFLALRHPATAIEPDVTNSPSPTLLSLRSLLSNNGMHPRQIAERLIGLDRLSIGYRDRYVTTNGPEFPPENARRVAAIIAEMAADARRCGADFRVAVLPGPNEAYYGIAEPATETLLADLRAAGNGNLVIDARAGIKPGSDFFLSGIDYPNAAGAAALAAKIAAQLPAPETEVTR